MALPLDAPADSCAWYGERTGRTLVFGIADFWPRFGESGGDPRADLETRGARWVGRFDLAEKRFLEPVLAQTTGRAQYQSGSWDVLPLGEGEDIVFTSVFEAGGRTGERSAVLPTGLSELAAGRDGHVVASRYSPEGSVLELSQRDMRATTEWGLPRPAEGRIAAKTVAYDAAADAFWLTTDRLDSEGGMVDARDVGGSGGAHPTFVLARATGAVMARIEDIEVQFVRFHADGRGVLVALDGDALVALELAADGGSLERRMEASRRTILDADFPASVDFAQDVTFGDRGDVVVTRWSGAVHVLSGDGGTPRRIDLPRYDAPHGPGLYYTAVAFDDELCATYCADLSVVCTSLR